MDLLDLYRQLSREEYDTEGLENISWPDLRNLPGFAAAIQIWARCGDGGAQRIMRVSLNRELEARWTSVCPSSPRSDRRRPYVGLLGQSGALELLPIAWNGQAATLAMVAPGISEALVATAMGLFAAIPAVMAYTDTPPRLVG